MRIQTAKKITISIIILLALALSMGCGGVWTRTRVIPPQGLLFSSVKAPVSINFDNTPAGRQLSRVSQSSTYYFRDFIITGMDFSWGSVGINEIARKGGLSRVYFADYEYLNILGIYAQFTINVYGARE